MKISPSPDKYLNIYPKYFSNRIMQDTREYVQKFDNEASIFRPAETVSKNE